MKRNDKRVILLDGINRVAYDLTLANSELSTSAGCGSLITAIQIIRNRVAYNVLQMMSTAQPDETFSGEIAEDLFFLGHLNAEPSAELYNEFYGNPAQEIQAQTFEHG